MYNYQGILVSIAALVILSGCSTPFADRITYDTNIRNAPGTITLSDPKLYTREALISERSRDSKWIDQLITDSTDSTKVIFTPEIRREVEKITAFAAAIGLKFDPAAAATYRQNRETGDLQHQIDVIKLQLQLDQLKRDANLVRANLDSQTTPVTTPSTTTTTTTSTNNSTPSTTTTTTNNSTPSTTAATASGSTPSTTAATASAADQLQTAIGSLNANLSTLFGSEGKLPTETPLKSTPFDDFRDRSAYRDMLKAAQNSAGLDQLHDYANARLIRLNFQASVLPDSDNQQSLGAIEVHVSPPDYQNVAVQQFFQNWLEYINMNKEYRLKDNNIKLDEQNQVIQELLLSGSFEKMEVSGVELLVPLLIDETGESKLPSMIYERSHWSIDKDSANKDNKEYQSALSKLSSIMPNEGPAILVNICSNKPSAESNPIYQRIEEAVARERLRQYIQLAKRVFYSIPDSNEKKLNLPELLIDTDLKNANLKSAHNLHSSVLNMMTKLPECKVFSESLKTSLPWQALSRPSITDDNKIRVYEIGPREQVQQVSTVARSANSLALAASLAATNPGSGIGADAAASYSRQAMGRATAMERVPSVVGYSQAGESFFGWVLGPHAVLNAKGHIDMAQLLKTYDLAVDMAVPGWWPALNLNVTTAWAPSPARIASGKLRKLPGDEESPITVRLVRNSVDEFDSLTQYIIGHDSRITIDSVLGGPINVCDTSTLLITGKNIWRAKQVFVLGQKFEGDAITITADMKGILLSLPAIPQLANGKNNSDSLSVITPLGRSNEVEVQYEPKTGGCKKETAQPDEKPKDAVSVSSVEPLGVVVPSSPEFRVKGANLEKVVEVRLDGQPAITPQPSQLSKDKTSLKVKFDKSSTESIRESDNSPLEFFEKDKTSDEISSKASQTMYIRTIRKK